MLKTILSVTGKPGLYKLVSSGKNMVIVESLADKRKMPIYARDKVVSLGDIAMYTIDSEVPLQEVLTSIKKKENGQVASIPSSAKPEELQKYLGEVLPAYDKDRVYNADIKKLITWYNLLIGAEIDFEAKEVEAETAQETVVEEAAPAKEAAPKAEKAKKAAAPKKETKAAAEKTAKAPKATKAKKEKE